MDNSKYIDQKCIMQVLGGIFLHPDILDRTDKYPLVIDDFATNFHKLIYGAITNLYHQGVTHIDIIGIDNYLSNRPNLYAIYNNNSGTEYLKTISQITDYNNFDYYYNRLKKLTLLRMYSNYGLNVDWVYNPDTLDLSVKQKQEDWLDSHSPLDITYLIDEKFNKVKQEALLINNNGTQAGNGINELIAKLLEEPALGAPMYGKYINTITRGARLKKFYLRSSASGFGKSRSMIADICTFSCGKLYNLSTKQWENSLNKLPSLFITTELDLEEVQTMMLAFLSGVNENHIVTGKYEFDELDRVQKAAELIQQAPLWIEYIPDFGIEDIENKIKVNVYEHNVQYVGFDYMHMSTKLMYETTQRSGGVKLREDSILFLFSTKLKDLCNELGIFILSSTQVNGDYANVNTADQNCLRGQIWALIYLIQLTGWGLL